MDTSIAGSAAQNQGRSIDPLKIKSKAWLRFETDEDVCGLQKKEVAFYLQTSDAQLTRYRGDQYDDDLPAHKVPLVTRKFGPGYMERLARECGGTYRHGESLPASSSTVLSLIGLLAKQSGTTIQQLVQDLEDHVWTAEERRETLPGLRALGALVSDLIRHAEEGAL